MRPPAIRAATPSDIDHLVALETDAFAADRLSRRSFERFLSVTSAECRLAPGQGGIAGYYLLLFRKTSRLARLYSIAVAASRRGEGLAAALLDDAESVARQRGAARIGLEVREDNPAAIRLYERHGYTAKGRYPDYYADGAAARRYEKSLDRPAPRRSRQADD